MIAHLYSNTKPFETEMSRENSFKMLSFAINNDAIFEMFLHLRASLVVTSRWPETSKIKRDLPKSMFDWNSSSSSVRNEGVT